jgi:hypothetical protein
MAVAIDRHAQGDYPGAAAAMLRAIEVRRAALTAVGLNASPNRPSLDIQRLTDALVHDPPDRDPDGDWVPDVIERTVGLDPTRVDSDGNGVPDDEEDTDRNGLANGLEWVIVADPTRVAVHFGAVDPEREGYRRERTFDGRAAPPDGQLPSAWRATADRMGFYYLRLTDSQKHAALTRGWRLLSRGALRRGSGIVQLDLGPRGSRFDQAFSSRAPGVLQVRAWTSVVPEQGDQFDLGPGQAWPAVEWAFNPSVGAATLMIGGKHVQTGYGGHHQFQEDFGLLFGPFAQAGSASRGEADFGLVLLQIR